jgi:hypothetical protein
MISTQLKKKHTKVITFALFTDNIQHEFFLTKSPLNCRSRIKNNMPNINCKPHWHAMKLTTTKICIYEVPYTCYLSNTFFPPSTVQSRCIYEVPYTCYLSSTFFLPSRVQKLEKTLVKHANNIFCTWQSTFSRTGAASSLLTFPVIQDTQLFIFEVNNVTFNEKPVWL